MPLIRVGAFLLLATTVLAQAPPQFDVASIHASSEQTNAVNVGLRITGTQLRIVSLSLKDYIGMAYQMKPSQVIAPEWASQLRFDISGNIPDGATRDQIPAMLQSLLADRFDLKVHRDRRDFPVYALVEAKGGLKVTGTAVEPGATPASAIVAGGSGSGAGVTINLGGDSSFTLAANKLEVHQMTMAQLAESLSRFTDRTVIDGTSLAERFDFALDLTPDDYQLALMRAGVNNGIVLPAPALRLLDASPQNVLGPYFEKVGLTLDGRRAPLDVIVVDSASKTPKEN